MKRYFLGQAASYSFEDVLKHTFAVGRKKDCDDLAEYLNQRYGGETFLCKNGRSALCLALKTYFGPGDKILVNGFTCYAVYEAIKAAKLVPVFIDISREDLNFNTSTLGHLGTKACGIIIQNTLGNPVDIKAIEKFAKEHELTIIEDLAHCTGVKYADGRECGTVGAAAAFSFGKDKSIDTISGGAVVLRHPCKHEITAPSKLPKLSCHLRARFYPLFGLVSRKLSCLHLGGVLMRGLVKIHWVEKSADSRLDLEHGISKFEAKLALEQFKKLKKSGEPPLREFCFVRNRDEALKKLARAGYYFDGLWYKQPVSPERYYKKVHFPEKKCPEAVYVAEHIINLPTYYSRKNLAPARKIIAEYLEEEP